jgi:hypothetical protein
MDTLLEAVHRCAIRGQEAGRLRIELSAQRGAQALPPATNCLATSSVHAGLYFSHLK